MFLLLVVFLCIGVYNIYLTQISFKYSIFTTLGIGVMVLLITMLVYRFPRRIISILDNYVYVKACIRGRSRTQDFTVNLLYLTHFKLSNIKFIQLKLSQVIHGTNCIMHCEAHLHTCTIYDFLTHTLPQVHVVFGTTWSKYTNLL